MEDEHFIVWMRPAGLPNFRKLWGRIEKDHYKWDKSIILSITNKFKGKILFLGVCFIVIGIFSLVFGFAFPLLICQRNKNESLKKNI